MFRLHAQLLTIACVVVMVVLLFAETSTSQGTKHSLSLNGTSNYMSVPYSGALDISGPLTVEAWIKLSSINGNYQDIVCREAWGQAGTGGGYEFAITSAGKLRLDLYQSHNQYTTAIGSTTVTTNVWHHVAGVFDGNQMRVYLDGQLDGSLSTTSGPAQGTSPLNIGKSTYTTYYFGGLIDEVRISAAALYSSNFTAGLGPASNTRALWKFDGQTTNDTSGNSNQGTLQGGATYSTDVPATSNNAPTVTLTDPQSNTSFTSGSTIVIDASASDSDGIVSRVDFYQGTTLLGTDTSSPYTFTWNNVQAGTYSLTAKATDDGGAVSTSSAITVNVLGSSSFHSLSLNGTSSYVSVPNSSTINISGPITVEAWIKLNSINGNYQDIVCREAWGQAGTGGGYELSITNTGKARLDLYQSHNQYTTAIGSTTVTTNVWHHVAGVFDGNQMRVYLDGQLDGSLSTTSGPASGTSVLNIGKSTYTTYYFGGLIDEVRISATALYSSNFTPGLPPVTDTRALWKFDGQTANDSSGNGNHGTLQNASYSTDVPSIGGGSQRPVPVVGGPYTAQMNQAVSFNGSGSFDPDGTISSYHWNFGDGTSANTSNPSHAYQTSGLLTATLTVTDNAGLRSSATVVVTITGTTESRLDPRNQTGGGGENALSQNFNWTLPLLSLPGRSGMDLGLMLSYNSLVWTKNASGNYVSFDEDRGFPSPGFRLGFPVIQPLYFNSEVGKSAFLMIGPDGSRTELRHVGTSALYEAADSSHLLLDTDTMTLLTSEGTQLSYAWMNSEYDCTQIKDRNGNYITINYTPFGKIDTVIDTLARSIKFNYDVSGFLTSITQVWKQGSANPVTHNWAVFTYGTTLIQTNFSGLTVFGPANNFNLKTLSKITLADGSHTEFSYTSWGQVWKVSNFAPNNDLLSYRAYKLPGSALLASSAQSDCPRFTERRDWAKYWNGDTNGDPDATPSTEDAVTSFAEPVADTWTMPDETTAEGKRVEVTSPDGTVNKIYFIGTAGNSSAWRRGLPALVVTYSGGVWQRKVMTTWTQENTAVFYPLNPRVTETNIYDPSGNRARTRITYQHHDLANGTSCDLPKDVFEYAADATTILRSTRTTYNMAADYTNLHILGLPSVKSLYEGEVDNGGALMSKLAFFYDQSGSIDGTDAPVQHDNTSYSSSFLIRGNLSSVKRYDVTNTNVFTTTSSKYNTAGSVVSSTDAANHTVSISYIDSFSDGTARSTLAYPTKVTDADNYYSTTVYNFDFGAITKTKTPPPNLTGAQNSQDGPERAVTYDELGRIERTTNLVNNAYARLEYSSNAIRVDSYRTIQDGLGEAHSFKYSDGAGRVIATATDHNATTFSGQKTVYDVLGRVIKTSNPTETAASGMPLAWNTAGDDANTGWIYTEQTYDWKGRPLVTTNPDLTTSTASYSGCGCAGGEVVTLTDEGTIDGGVTKRRQQKIYSDVLGRTVKTEVLNWEGGSIYSTIVNSYNVRDQLTQSRQFAGAEGSATFQETTLSYDGFGRPSSRHLPEQNVGTSTVYTYNADDIIQSVSDARGAIATYGYNNRHLLTSVSFTAPTGITIPAAISYSYDGAGNRSSMNDGSGTVAYQYDALSRLTSETRTFVGLAGSYTLSYQYNLAGELKKITDPSGASISYNRDKVGRLTSVNGEDVLYNGVSQYATNFTYSAWGAVKSLAYGNTTNLSLTYNQRGLITQYAVGGVKEGSTQVIPEGGSFQYYSDGRLKFASDARTAVTAYSLHDRAFSYDQLGRLKDGYSGTEARDFLNGTSSGIFDGAFRQTYSHDVFGNLTGRVGRFWSETDSASDSYNNQNRNPTWEYDAEGRLISRNEPSGNELPYQPLRFSYDAAGQRRQSSQTASTHHPITNAILTTVTTRTEEYDGNGAGAKSSTTTQTNGGTAVTNTRFYLRSSVLNGQTVAEYDASGVRQAAYVFMGTAMLAQQERMFDGTTRVLWRHQNPVIGDGLDTDIQGQALGRATVDPMAVDLGDTNPFSGGGGSGEAGISQSAIDSMVAQFIPGYGGRQVKLDGFVTSPYLVASVVGRGAAVSAPSQMYVGLYNRAGKNVGLAVWNPTAAEKGIALFGRGSLGFLPAGSTYNAGQGISFPNWFASLNVFPGTRPFGSMEGVDPNFLSERSAQLYSSLRAVGEAFEPQNQVTEDDRPDLQGDNNGKDCGVIITFKPGTTYPGTGLPNGPSTIWNGGPNFGLGFSVTGWVGSGGIGTIGFDPKTGKKVTNPDNPTGRWSLEQWTHTWIGENGKQLDDKGNKTFPDLPLKEVGLTAVGNKFSFYDHAGGVPPSAGLRRFENHLIKVYSGKTVCEVTFHFIQTGTTIHWGPGAL